jgi:hypothetical protein
MVSHAAKEHNRMLEDLFIETPVSLSVFAGELLGKKQARRQPVGPENDYRLPVVSTIKK